MNPRKNDTDQLELDVNTLKGDMARSKKDVEIAQADIRDIFEKIANLPLISKVVFGLVGTVLTGVILGILALVLEKTP